MQTAIVKSLLETAAGAEADSILRSCVHCGFCTATCPTYQLLGDELDGPRGRIYLIKQLLEGGPAGIHTRRHLDRCLLCRSCETTCPSGVRYGRLLEIGRGEMEQRLRRPLGERLVRWVLRQLVPYPGRFGLLIRFAQPFRRLLPGRLRQKLPTVTPVPALRSGSHGRRVILMEGCAQKALTPGTNVAVARVLDRLGISVITPRQQGCCGALSQHLSAEPEAIHFVKANIDAWWPHVEAGAEAVVITASGCGSQVRAYGEMLRGDPDYGRRAERISALAKDLVELLRGEDLASLVGDGAKPKVAYQSPCSMQHALGLTGEVEGLLRNLGFELPEIADAHLCCGSAGSYSLLQPQLSGRLLKNKLRNLESRQPDLIATANVGCQLHLQAQARVPVKHWVELIDEAILD